MTHTQNITKPLAPEPVIGRLWEHYPPGRRITRVCFSHRGYAIVVTGDVDVEIAYRLINGRTVWTARGKELPVGVEDHESGVEWARRYIGGVA